MSASILALSSSLLACGSKDDGKKHLHTKGEVVVLNCRDARLGRNKYNRKALRKKLDSALMQLTGEKESRLAWRALFSPKDIVGLKLNCLAGIGLSSTPELVFAVTDALLEIGIPEKNIIIWERSDRELLRAGFRLNRSGKGIRIMGTERDYEPQLRIMGSMGSCLSRLFTESTALINIGVVKDHNLAGATIGMKNLFGIIHNPNKYHFNNCDPYVAELSASKPVRKRLRLIIADALWAQCHNGPARDDHYRWQADTVIVGLDPVAVDAVGINMIEERRKKMGLKSLAEEGRPPKWLKTAEEMGLGVRDLNKIKVVNI